MPRRIAWLALLALLALLTASGRASVDRPQARGYATDTTNRLVQYRWTPSSSSEYEVPSGYYYKLYRCWGTGSTPQVRCNSGYPLISGSVATTFLSAELACNNPAFGETSS